MSLICAIRSIGYRHALIIAALASILTAPTPVDAQTLAAVITYPANLATNVDVTLPIQWTAVANAQGYYLYVGSTSGAKDLVNTGTILETSYLAPSLPAGQTLYARIWSLLDGHWQYRDSTFIAAPVLRARITYPGDGAVGADLTKPIQWISVPTVEKYYLYVGSTPGAKDLVNTGEILQTSYLPANLPHSQTLYARMWTKAGGVWRYADSTFSAAPRARITYPANSAVQADLAKPIQWTSVANVQAYYLYVGSTLGAKDLANSGETLQTSYLALNLPAYQILYARLWTKAGGVWRFADSTFAGALAPAFIYPTDGMVAVDRTRPFQWAPPANALAHELRVGTTPGGNDVFDSGGITATSVLVTGLPGSGPVYARALSNVNGIWYHTDIAFTLEPSSPISTMVVPRPGEVAFDTRLAFTWESVPLARAYHLTIGTVSGASNLHDSGEIHVTRRFVPNLPLGPLFGRLQTKIHGTWYSSDFTFSVLANTVSADPQIESALWATDVVRSMALTDNRPFTWTELAREIPGERYRALCVDYAETLLQVMTEMNGQLAFRRLDIALNPNDYDAHTLVEMFNSTSQSWMLLDPTFDLSVRRTSDGQWATAEDVSTATSTQQWGNLSYAFLGPSGDSYARNYYLDYPLLFVNVYHAGQLLLSGQGGPVLPYMLEVPFPISSSYTMYAVGCSETPTTVLRVDGIDRIIDCSGVDGLSYVFGARSILPTAQTAPTVKAYRPRRYVF